MDLFHSSDFGAQAQDLMQRYHVPCVVAAIVQSGNISSTAWGQASINPPKPCTPDTLFDIASASKSLTGASVGLLVDDNENYPDVQWDSIMSKLLPDDFVMSDDDYTQRVTLDDIISHRTGLPTHDSSYLGENATHPDDAQSITRNLRNLDIAAPIRTKFQYCNMMYTVATYLVETFSGMEFADFLDTHFFQPLNMTSTNLQLRRAREKGLGDRVTQAFQWDNGTYTGSDSPYVPESQGAGSIITSVNDYILWIQAMIEQGGPVTDAVYRELVRERFLDEDDYALMIPHAGPSMYAAGWDVYYYRGHILVTHDGGIDGFSSTTFFVPDLEFGGVVFTNSDGGFVVKRTLMHELLDAAYGVEPGDTDWESFWNSDDDDDETSEDVVKELCPGASGAQPQEMPLDVYTGTYSNPGYHEYDVQVQDGKLFIDATDRSNPFNIEFEHACNQTKYVAHQIDSISGADDPLKSEFVLDNGRAVKLGIYFESELPDYIWFDRVDNTYDG